MESTALPISSFGIQQATACGEPRYFRLKKNLLIGLLILSILGKIYIIAIGEELVSYTEKALDNAKEVEAKEDSLAGQEGIMGVVGVEMGKKTRNDEATLETAVKMEKTVIAIYVVAALVDAVFLYGIWTERMIVAQVVAILICLSAAFRIVGFVIGNASFQQTALTTGAAILCVLYWIDLKNMATSV